MSCHGPGDILDPSRFRTDRVVQCQWAIEYAAGDLSAVGHLAQGGGFDRRLQLGIDLLHRRQDGNLRRFDLQGVRQVDRVLHDIDLVLEGRKYVDRSVGNDQHVAMMRNIHDEAMTEPSGGA